MKPRLLDLFCGAGGSAVGYHRAGFEVVGVDIKPQPNYPFEFVQQDALEALADLRECQQGLVPTTWDAFHAIHASPPCQAHTTMSNRWRGAGGKADEHDDLIPATRELLQKTGLPWVIENVPGAKGGMRSPLKLNGSMFGLGVLRPRSFESNVLLSAPQGGRSRVLEPVGVYGKAHDGRLLFRRKDGSEQRAASSLAEARAAMGIDWMEWRELAESIPPSYTEWIGHQLLASLTPSNPVSREYPQETR